MPNRLNYSGVIEPSPLAGLPRAVSRLLLTLFAAQLILVVVTSLPPSSRLVGVAWPDGALLVLASASTIASLTRHLPGQNVILAAVLIGAIGGGLHALGALTGVPFGPFQFTGGAGRELIPGLPWSLPFLWLVLVVNSRGVARLILRPWRASRDYGFWLIGLTALLCAATGLALEPYVTRVKRVWEWTPTRLPLDWYGAPLTNFLSWGVGTLLIMAIVAPVLINKRPAKMPADFHPLILWGGLMLVFVAGASSRGLWPAAALAAVEVAGVAALAVRGARRGDSVQTGAGGSAWRVSLSRATRGPSISSTRKR